ncbi:Hypothetical predicted protein [Octopus vulgaris]|uniref:Uncharacterized protein n=1 Tax=Octopus vulgaris TaxID=6645 RepID=A0AA36AYQ3_OCTVU|nr:Hypothetical predicted protein [Octopus vulgaris]
MAYKHHDLETKCLMLSYGPKITASQQILVDNMFQENSIIHVVEANAIEATSSIAPNDLNMRVAFESRLKSIHFYYASNVTEKDMDIRQSPFLHTKIYHLVPGQNHKIIIHSIVSVVSDNVTSLNLMF